MEISQKPFLMYWAKQSGGLFLLQSPGDAAIFPGSLRVQMPFASWQLHLWMIHLTNRPVFKCICSEEAVVFQTGTPWAADIFTGRESRQCKNRCLTFIEPPSWGRCTPRMDDILKPMFHTDLLSSAKLLTVLYHTTEAVEYSCCCLYMFSSKSGSHPFFPCVCVLGFALRAL